MSTHHGAIWSLILVSGLSFSNSIFSGSELTEHLHARPAIARRERVPVWSKQQLGFFEITPNSTEAKTQDGATEQPLFEAVPKSEFADEDDAGVFASQLCAIEYRLGVANGTTCIDESSEEIMIDPSNCEEAINETGLTQSDDFYIESVEFHIHPRGCFAAPCDTEDPEAGVCYFYNGIKDQPDAKMTNFSGRPVCARQRFLNGTRDQNGGCPTGYSDILDKNSCREFADCRGHCKGAYFDVTEFNYSMHHEFPVGCFIRETDNCVYFNPADEEEPQRPKGMPVCNTSALTGLTMANLWTHTGR